MRKFGLKTLLILIASTAMVACNGGGGGGGEAKKPATPSTPETPNKPNEPSETPNEVIPEVSAASTEWLEFFKAADTAKADRRSLLVVVGSADSPESLLAEEKLNEIRDEDSALAEEIKKNFDVLKFERMFFHSFSQVLDFLPGGSAVYYPSVYMYEPEAKRWALLPIDPDSTELTEQAIQAFLDNESVGELMDQKLKRMLNRNDFSGNDDESVKNLGFLAQTVFSASIDDNYGQIDFSGLTERISDKANRSPKRFNQSIIDIIRLRGWQNKIVAGKIGASKVFNEIPNDGRLLTTTTMINVYAPVAYHVTRNSYSQAATECVTKQSDWKNSWYEKSKDLSIQRRDKVAQDIAGLEAEYQQANDNGEFVKAWNLKKRILGLQSAHKTLDANVNSAAQAIDLTCALLRFRADNKTAGQLKEKAASIKSPALEPLREQISIAYALAGDFGKATEIRKAHIDALKKGYDENIKGGQAQVDVIKAFLAEGQASAEDVEILNEEIAKIEKFIDVNQKLKTRVDEAFSKLKKAWGEKSIVVK